MGGVGPLVVVECHPLTDVGPGLRTGLPGAQIHALVCQGSPEAFDEDVVDAAAPAVHRDLDAGAFHAVGPGERRELAALIAVHDLWPAEAVHRFIERLNTELGLVGVRDPPCQDLARRPVHDRNQIEEGGASADT